MTVLKSHDFQYTAASLQQLHAECKIPYTQMNDVRVCVLIARQHPETLDMLPKKKDQVPKVSAVEEAKAAAAKQSDGMDDFQLVSKDAEGKPKLPGNDLLMHMIKLRNPKFVKEIRRGPTAALDVHLYDDLLEMIQPTAEDMRAEEETFAPACAEISRMEDANKEAEKRKKRAYRPQDDEILAEASRLVRTRRRSLLTAAHLLALEANR